MWFFITALYIYFCIHSHAAIHQLSCLPKQANAKEKTSVEMMRERELWKPLDNYGTDNMYCISPPLVPEESQAIYEECVSNGKRGKFDVAQLDQLVYSAFNGCYPTDESTSGSTDQQDDTSMNSSSCSSTIPTTMYTPPLIVK